MEHISCILCGSDEGRPYAEENGHQALKCDPCSLVYVSPRPTIHEMKELYQGQETQIDLHGHLQQRDHKCVQARKCLEVLQRHCPTGRLLEVGSAAGYFLWEANKLGYDVQGLDITRQFVQFSTEVLGVPAHEGTLHSAPFEDGSFDIVYMRNVLSHLSDPLAEHATLKRLLRPGGWLVFETGNVAELTPEIAGELELPDHLFHFSEGSIRTLLDRAGFECVEVHRHGLIGRLEPIRRISEVFSHNRSPRKTAVVEPEMVLPRSHWTARWGSRLAQFVRYDLGRIAPQNGRRCTLVVVAQSREKAETTAP
jgi:SAM-dependent methyltransferase